MEYDRGDNFTSDFKPNEIPFGSKSNGKLPPLSYSIQFERKLKYDRGDSFLLNFEPIAIPFGSENRTGNNHHEIEVYSCECNSYIIHIIISHIVHINSFKIRAWVQKCAICVFTMHASNTLFRT